MRTRLLRRLASTARRHCLKQKGIIATVYEANTRLGGRCWTNRTSFANGQIAERGGEFIDQAHTATRQLARELGHRLHQGVRVLGLKMGQGL
jgi:monoamine oxidase